MDRKRSLKQKPRSKTDVRSISKVFKRRIAESSIASRLADLLMLHTLKMVLVPMGCKTIFRNYNINRRRILFILFICGPTFIVHLFHSGSGILSPFVLVGLLDRNEVDTDNWATIYRVSTREQVGDGSLKIQKEEIDEERKKAGGEIVYTSSGYESARSIDRETLEDIVTLAQEGEIDVIGAYRIDRITRAVPMESMKFYVELYEAGVTIYIGKKEGYLDWHDLDDYRLITDKTESARRRLNEILGTAAEGYIRGLKQGKWRYGDIHFGYTVDDELNILLTDLGEKVLPRIFEVYIETENRSKTVDIINDEFDLSGDDKLSSGQVRRVIASRKCIGELWHNGQHINTKPELAVVSKEQFRQAQKIAEENRNTPSQDEIWPPWMSELAKRYNLTLLISEIENLQERCGKCDGELIRYGTQETRETTVPKIKCKDCGHQGPLITREEFDQLHSTAPVRCPECVAVGGVGAGVECEEIEGGRWDYMVTCRLCGYSFGTNSAPEPYEEAVDQPRLELIREAQDVAELLEAILKVKKQAAATGPSARPEQADSPESDESPEQQSIFSFS